MSTTIYSTVGVDKLRIHVRIPCAGALGLPPKPKLLMPQGKVYPT